jgi:hypothetical protein
LTPYQVVCPALLDIDIEATEQKEHCFKHIFRPYPALRQLDIKFHHYGDWVPSGYFDFTTYPEDMELAIQIKVPDTYIEAPVSLACAFRVADSDQTSP